MTKKTVPESYPLYPALLQRRIPIEAAASFGVLTIEPGLSSYEIGSRLGEYYLALSNSVRRHLLKPGWVIAEEGADGNYKFYVADKGRKFINGEPS